jgi:TRAP-type transport system periplasmic protein
LSKTMDVYALTPEEKAQFRDVAQPAVKEVIVKTFGAEGEDMMNAFLAAIDEASK